MKKTTEQRKAEALKSYEKLQAENKRLLKRIEVGLEKHDKEASLSGGHHWGYAGDMERVKELLKQVSDMLHHEGEYAS